MAAQANATKVVPAPPVVIEEHEAEMELRRNEQEKKRAKMIRCLDPVVANQYEIRKPIYEWLIEVEIFRPAGRKGRAKHEKFSEKVVAQTENDAWALFCDKIGEYPSRRDSFPKITRLEQRTALED